MTQKAAKAAQHGDAGDLWNLQSGRAGGSENSESPTIYQARRLMRLHAVAFDTAVTLAGLAYSAGLPR